MEERLAGLAVATVFLAIMWVVWWRSLSFVHVVAAAGLVVVWWQTIREFRSVRRVFETREQIAGLTPAQFEEWCAHRLRSLGYRVQLVGGQGDHGIDLFADKDGERAVVQCKRFTASRTVGEPHLRDLFGAMHAEGATKAIAITAGYFTEEARTWARNKPIELWDVDRIVRQHIVSTAAQPIDASTVTDRSAAPKCLSCGGDLLVRRNRSTGEQFYGCSRYPSCRYTRPMERAAART